VRVCLLCLGVVLDSAGGAMGEMAKSFRFGVASWLGSGQQAESWVHRRDVIRAIQLSLARDDLQGPFNITVLRLRPDATLPRPCRRTIALLFERVCRGR
jgi:NAD dependent epimerase/dehydratase family enzyme